MFPAITPSHCGAVRVNDGTTLRSCLSLVHVGRILLNLCLSYRDYIEVVVVDEIVD
jgi:hypothetical protein